MESDNQLNQLDEARTQYHWAVANIGIALLCVVLAAGAFMYGYVVAGLLVLVVSVALVVTADSQACWNVLLGTPPNTLAS